MSDGITIKVLGDYGPFSRIGKSTGYKITIGRSSYLIDCGAPLFQQIGGHGLKALRGLIITHCHEDHKRWFSDLALFNRYAPDFKNRVFLLTTEKINEDLIRASGPSLETSLSMDSKNIIDIPYDDYIEHINIGPKPKYRIATKQEGVGKYVLHVTDRQDNIVGPETAKIIVSDKTGRPRLIFRDPIYDEWVEPENFYPFSSEVFYERDKNIYRDNEGFTIEAINAPVWHGIPSIGIRFATGKETLVFSSDTAHDVKLWEELHTQKHPQRFGMSKKAFEAASIIHGDINEYVERIWGEERYNEAIKAFDDSIVIHDIAQRKSIVHTDYVKLHNTVLKKEKTILTHSPDRMTSEWMLSNAEKQFIVKKKDIFEMVGDELFPMNADVYHKEGGRYFVGYKIETGNHFLYDKDGNLSITENETGGNGKLLYRLDLYEDISGRYFPKLQDSKFKYIKRPDGLVELVESNEKGSIGRIVKDKRKMLAKL